MTVRAIPQPVARPSRLRTDLAVRVVAVAVGLIVGASTSVLQAHLDSPWASLVNAASPWLARFAGVAAATLPAAFLAEAVVAYAIRLGYGSSAALFGAIGIALAILVAFRSRRPELVAVGLVPMFLLGVLAELALGAVYAQSV